MTLSPGSILGPYEILSSIGSGGMGEVWKARDTRLGRIVAIKKVKEQHSERFKQEARSIAALNHPHICQIFDIGDDYLVLEYVEGKPISSPLPEQEAVRLAIQIATALEAAHKKGIIHRDLKPSNIMVTAEGSVKLLDFGLAKLHEQDPSFSSLPTADFPATQAGAILGTVAYMSPEQAQGQPADIRSDIFSFGLVLYEMLSGKRAFSGDSNYAVMDSIVKQDPPPMQASPPLEKTVKQCLEKDPAERYQTMSEVKDALDKSVEGNVTIRSKGSQPSIAVLPFVNMSGDREQDYFSDGLAEEIINALTKIPGLKVIARTSAFAFRGKEQDIIKIAEALRVNTILEGSVRKAGNRIRVTAQLITASDGSHLWSERYDRDMADVFAIQDEISQAIAEKLRVQLSGKHPLVKQPTTNLEAYNLCLKGRYHYRKLTQKGMEKGKEYYERAIAIDENYAWAWCKLARFHYVMGYLGFTPQKAANAKAGQAIAKALELDDHLAEAHAVVGMLRTSEFNWKEGERSFLRALELDPGSQDILQAYSLFYLVPMQRMDEAIAASKKALELDPLSPHLLHQLGLRYFLNRQYDLSIEHLRNALELDSNYYLAHLGLGLAYIETGRLEEAIQAMQSGVRLSGRIAFSLMSFAYANARAGRIDEVKKALTELQDLAGGEYVIPSSFAMIHLGLGEIEKAYDWLEKAADELDRTIIDLHAGPFFDPLRSHPRYKALLRKMNLDP
jgi:serine/threonine protein kinase/tetratricopeptide (TPR) repeat protein